MDDMDSRVEKLKKLDDVQIKVLQVLSVAKSYEGGADSSTGSGAGMLTPGA